MPDWPSASVEPSEGRCRLATVPRFLKVLTALLVVFLAIQFVPYGRDHDNPRSIEEPKWDSTRTRALVVDSCFECHSNLTERQWFASVAPVSWLMQRDIENGREALNFSEWNTPQLADIDAVIASIRSKEMPPRWYRLAHGAARLSANERQELEEGLAATFSASPAGDE